MANIDMIYRVLHRFVSTIYKLFTTFYSITVSIRLDNGYTTNIYIYIDRYTYIPMYIYMYQLVLTGFLPLTVSDTGPSEVRIIGLVIWDLSFLSENPGKNVSTC